MEKAVVFGAGLSGLGAKELLEKKGYEVYLVDDKNGMPSSEAVELLDKEKIEFIVKSPGIPWKVELLVKAKDKNIKIISEIDLAYKYMDKNIKVISFTGTNGKTTTATKMYELLEYAGKKVKLAGNAGFSFAKLVADEEDLEYIVLELSSYQLENDPQIHSYIAGIINLTPDHLARYDSVEDYYITKFNIFSRQTEQDFALINLDDEVFQKLYDEKKLIGMGRIIGDGGISYAVTDIMVDKEYQGKGYGRLIMKEIDNYFCENTDEDCYIILIANLPADKLYSKFSFEYLPDNKCGMLRKQKK